MSELCSGWCCIGQRNSYAQYTACLQCMHAQQREPKVYSNSIGVERPALSPSLRLAVSATRRARSPQRRRLFWWVFWKCSEYLCSLQTAKQLLNREELLGITAVRA